MPDPVKLEATLRKIGMPRSLWLREFGHLVFQAFGHVPFQVGSSLGTDGFRDVDVRLILPDDEYAALGIGEPDPSAQHCNGKWSALCMAFSALGRQMTGLPIDFQIQQQTAANKEFGGKRRSSLFRLYPDCPKEHIAHERA